jgi:hypothetical protein
MPTPRRRTPRSKIDEERAHLLKELRSIEDTARPLIESYVTAERIEYLGGDPIVRRLNRLPAGNRRFEQNRRSRRR